MKNRLKLILKYILYSPLYFFYPTRYGTTIWLIGSSRSGTTWVSSLINLQGNYRELFEPFHPYLYEMKLAGFQKNLYLSERNSKGVIRLLARKVLQGRFYHPRVEESNRFINSFSNDMLIVKDIFANLMAFEITSSNKNVKPILLIRNPFAVALSKRNKKSWHWMADPKELLLQKELCDFLRPYKEQILMISDEGSYLDKQILIWSIVNYIPLAQFRNRGILITFYEDWVKDPVLELEKVYNYVNIRPPNTLDIKKTKKYQNPSKTSDKGNYMVSDWKEKLSLNEIESGIQILKIFEMDSLYLEDGRPNHKFFDNTFNGSELST